MNYDNFCSNCLNTDCIGCDGYGLIGFLFTLIIFFFIGMFIAKVIIGEDENV